MYKSVGLIHRNNDRKGLQKYSSVAYIPRRCYPQ